MPSEILITASLPPFLLDPLRASYRCNDLVHAADPAALLAVEGPRVRGLVQSGGTVTPTALLDELPNLGIISVFGVGYDGVPVDYCRQRGIMVAHTPDVLTDDVADVAVGLILMTGRGFAKAERFVRAGEWERRGGTRAAGAQPHGLSHSPVDSFRAAVSSSCSARFGLPRFS